MYPFTPSSSSPTTRPPSRASPPSHGGGGGGGGVWGPYSGSMEFDIHMASILIILVLATFLAFLLHAAIRFLLCLYRRRRLQLPPSPSLQKKQNDSIPSLADALPTLVFSPGTKLAGGAEKAECAICLSEFAEGERIQVLPACNHGFHVKCVEGWLVSKTSCPICRTSCQQAEAAAVAVAEP